MIDDLSRALDALHACDPSCTRMEWVAIMNAAKAGGLSVEDFDAWSSGGSNYAGTKDVVAVWRSIPEGRVGDGALIFKAAIRAGWNWSRHDSQVRPHQPTSKSAAASQQPRHKTLSPFALELLSRTEDVPDTVSAAYIVARGGAIPPRDGDLRHHSALRHKSGYIGPAMVAIGTHAVTREMMTLHFTWVREDGSKAEVEPARMLLAGHRKAGAVVRLWPDEAVDYGLGIAEGIETALTLARVLRPVWSLIDAGNMASSFPALPGIECLTIAADNDPAGITAANRCASRWVEAGCDVRIVKSPRAGQDLNDFVRAYA